MPNKKKYEFQNHILCKKVSSFALIIVSSVMIHSPKNFIAIETKSETSKEHRILEVGENAIECKYSLLHTKQTQSLYLI